MPSIRRLGPRCLLMMISLEPDRQHTHIHRHTHLTSPRLRLLVFQAAQVTHSSPDEVCHRGVWCLHESGCVCVCVWRQCVCASTVECIGEMERDLPSDPLECASLMNSSVTQLIAKPATDLAVASSPHSPTAGLLKHDTVCISQMASREEWVLGRWVCVHTHELIVFVAFGRPQ